MAKRGAEYPTAEAFLPRQITLPALVKAARGCRGCRLCEVGTQTVFGEGSARSRMMLIGEREMKRGK